MHQWQVGWLDRCPQLGWVEGHDSCWGCEKPSALRVHLHMHPSPHMHTVGPQWEALGNWLF